MGPEGTPSHSYLRTGHQFGVFVSPIVHVEILLKFEWGWFCLDQGVLSLGWDVHVTGCECSSAAKFLLHELSVNSRLQALHRKGEINRSNNSKKQIQHSNKYQVPTMKSVTLITTETGMVRSAFNNNNNNNRQL